MSDVCKSVESDQYLKASFDEAVLSLRPEQPFFNYDLGLAESELQILKSFQIDDQYDSRYYDFYYGDSAALTSSIKSFLESLSESNYKIAGEMSELISRLINNVIASSKSHNALIDIRATAKSGFGHLSWCPFWHIDPCVDQPQSHCSVVAFTLKGPATMFYPMDQVNRDEFLEVFLEWSENDTIKDILQRRQLVCSMLSKCKPVYAHFGQGTVFLTGYTSGALHAAPFTQEERLFIFIEPATKKYMESIRMGTQNKT
jgi:hypothetical protein